MCVLDSSGGPLFIHWNILPTEPALFANWGTCWKIPEYFIVYCKHPPWSFIPKPPQFFVNTFNTRKTFLEPYSWSPGNHLSNINTCEYTIVTKFIK